ncbi:MAG: c-type cytochrome [Planctomycetes bacterium]|nr:c-type cytochrome [Planctomycetota bacterium]
MQNPANCYQWVARFSAFVMVACSILTSASEARLLADDINPRNTQAAGQEPLAPYEAIKQLHVPDGFQVTLAAAEPDVRQPIAITFDDRGRLWVAESYSYDGSTFTDEPHDRILIFEDTTGDGVLDQRRVFCDGLTHLTGLEIGFGGVWITAPPHLAFIPDRDRNDVPDGDSIIHLEGWSLKAEHNSVNGLTWGPDGWLYGRHGIKQPSHVGRPGDAADQCIELSCSIWRYHPTRHRFEVVADGTINPWGLDFDDYGQGFLTTSVVEHLWHLVPGAHYERWKNRGVHPNPYVYEAMTATSDHRHWFVADESAIRKSDLGAIHDDHDTQTKLDFGGGHSHCDAMIYLGDRWPAEFRGSVFMSNIHGRRINHDKIVRSTGPYRAEHADDFLVADDPWFRAVSMKYGPDGDVYVTDWSDNGECHDRDGVHRTSGRIYKITWGKPIRVPVELANAPTEQLVKHQLHDNDWFVRHARRILQERAAAGQDMSQAHAELKQMFASNPDITRKLRAMWALHSSDGADDDWLITQTHHESEHVRSWAVRLLVDQTPPPEDIIDEFTELARAERSWLVRMTLASALQRVPVGKRWPIAAHLAGSAASNKDLNLVRMIWYAIEPEIATHPERAIRAVEAVSARLRRWMARRMSEHSAQSRAFLFDALDQSNQPDVLADLLSGFNEATNQFDSPPIAANRIVRKLIEHHDSRVRIAAVSAAAMVGDDSTIQHIRGLLHDAGTDAETRQAALAGLVRRNPSHLADDLQQLIVGGRLTASALQAATAVNEPELARTVLNRYDGFSKADRNAAIDLLAARRTNAGLLVHATERNEIPVSDITAAQARQIAALNDANLLERLERVWGTVRPSSAERLRQIKAWEHKLDPSRIAKADLANGRRIFKETCASCHKLFGEGRTVGPELTGANRRNLHYLVSNIIDPSAAVPVDFRLAIVATKDGRVITGAILRKTDSTLALQTPTEEVQIKLDDIDEIKMSPKSIMPDGLLDKLTDIQISDLFAWMMSNGPLYGVSKQETSTHDATAELPVVILLGDSIRINYQKTVAAELQDKATVWSPEENCRHTAYTLEQLEKWVAGRNASVVHINVGLHDLFLNSKTDQPRHSLAVYSTNLRKIFARLKELTDAEVIFALTTPVDESWQAASKTYKRVVRRNLDVIEYNLRATEIATAAGIRVNDIYGAAIAAGKHEILRESDGIHLSKRGEAVIGKEVAHSITFVLSEARR